MMKGSQMRTRAPKSLDANLSTGVRLRYVEQGDADGEVLICLHAYTDSSFSFSRLMPLLPASLRVFALDQRGHGDSERPACCYSIDDVAADAVAFLDAVDVDRAAMVGHSMGSLVARQVAEGPKAPAHVWRLALDGIIALDDTADGVSGHRPHAALRAAGAGRCRHRRVSAGNLATVP